jgi:hypothetical protein
MEAKMAEEQKVAAIVNAAGAIYADVILQESKTLEANNEPVTADALAEAMSERFRISGGGNKSDTEDKVRVKETALAATNYFPGVCHNCNKKGHMAVDCPEERRQGSGGQRFAGSCNMCDTQGHREKDCWEKEENANRRPKGWKSRLGNKREAAGTCVEIMLCRVDIEDIESTKGELTSIMAGNHQNKSTSIMAGDEKKESQESTSIMAGDDMKLTSIMAGNNTQLTSIMAGNDTSLTSIMAGNDKRLTSIMAGNNNVAKKSDDFIEVSSTELKTNVEKSVKDFEQGGVSEFDIVALQSLEIGESSEGFTYEL